MRQPNFGWDYPPGVTESMIPGNRPGDVAWDNYWEDTNRPESIFTDTEGPPPTPPEDLYGLYESNKIYRKSIDEDFKAWLEPDGEPEDDYCPGNETW